MPELQLGDRLLMTRLSFDPSYFVLEVERIIYGPDIVLVSDGRWLSLYSAISHRKLYDEFGDKVEFDAFPRRSPDVFMKVPLPATNPDS